MRNIKVWLLLVFGLGFFTTANANIDPTKKPKKSERETDRLNFREDCDNSLAQRDMAINNVRARLLNGGDVWWDGNDGRYVVPKVPAGIPEVSSIFSGAVWLGGLDPAGNLKVAAQIHGRSGGDFDFYPGPLQDSTGRTDQATCSRWDKIFQVSAEEIQEHLRLYRASIDSDESYTDRDIPEGVKGWPAKGNEFFADVHRFDLPNTSQGLAGFWDEDGDGLYNPLNGDYPIIEIRGCPEPQFPDEMMFWIYNDVGNEHRESGSETPIQMEVQVQAFAYRTNDDVNNMTFQRYKLINRAIESIDSTFFAMFVDPDLGCFDDDYVGCDVGRDLAYIYNQDAIDGQAGCECGEVNTYCEDIPLLGIDYFRGPLNENFEEIGMSSFTYFNNAGVTPTPLPGTTDPNSTEEYYNYISGSWRDGSPFEQGGDAYQEGTTPINYAFIDAPNNINGWSMVQENAPPGDRRTLQASGPFRLDPGAVNELIVGVVWVADIAHPAPSIRRLQEADDIAQALFDNCFKLTRGPDAPDIDFIELDEEIIAIFTNDPVTSNNAFEAYVEEGLKIPEGVEDNEYRFEGYKLYQFADPSVTVADFDNPDKVRLIAQVDLKNNIGKIFNWDVLNDEDQTPTSTDVFVPVLEVDGQDGGIRHTFRITEDLFSKGDGKLINHKKYYFTAVAYAYNNYEDFDPNDGFGQREPYLEGDRNIGDGNNDFYTVIPRPIVDRNLNAQYGEGTIIIRTDGIGTGGGFLDISAETRQAIEDGSFNGEITYEPGRGPFEVQVFNPLDVKNGEFELRFVDSDLNDERLDTDARWELSSISGPDVGVIASETTIEKLNEQIIKELGFSITLGQVGDAGSDPIGQNGAVGYEESYIGQTDIAWISGVPDNTTIFQGAPIDLQMFNYVLTARTERDFALDEQQALSSLGNGYFIPYFFADYQSKGNNAEYISPGWIDNLNRQAINAMSLADLNNVDIVLTPDKSLWSRCPVLEMANRFYQANGLFAEGNRKQFDLRADKSVSKDDNDGDGLPDEDDTGTVGLGWFPGYAIDVETGQRLNILFGENSVYNGELLGDIFRQPATGGDMMFNPTSEIVLPPEVGLSIFNYLAGGQHMVYVMKTPYDETVSYRTLLGGPAKFNVLKNITWAGFLMAAPGTEFNSYQDGLIPNEAVIKLRVNNPYSVEGGERLGTGQNNFHPAYRFSINGKQAAELDDVGRQNALDMINVVPNPYNAYSDYENTKLENIVKFTNLPSKCTVTIYSLDGKFIRQYDRDEVGIVPRGSNRALERAQELPDLEWDLKNSKGIPIASGVYLIHVDAPGLGERTLKWFGINRKFDPSGL